LVEFGIEKSWERRNVKDFSNFPSAKERTFLSGLLIKIIEGFPDNTLSGIVSPGEAVPIPPELLSFMPYR